MLDLLSAALSSTSGTDGTPALSAVSVCTAAAAAAAAVEGTGHLEKLEIFVRPSILPLAGGEPFWYLEHLPRYTPLCDTRRTAAGIADFPPWARG